MDGEFGKREQEWHIWGSVCEFPGDLMGHLPVGQPSSI